MSLFNKVFAGIEKNKAIRDAGGYVGIPFPFPRLRKYIPVIEKGHSIGVLAGTGVGKSRFTRYLFLYHVYEFAKKNNYPIKVYYFPLEDNKEKVYLNMCVHYLKKVHKIRTTVQELSSKNEKGAPQFIIDALSSMEEFFEDFENYVIIVDHLTHPKDIFEFLRKEAMNGGSVELRVVDGKEVPFKYTPNDETHRLVIIDNLHNFDAEKNEDERQLIVDFCRRAVRKWLCNFFNFTVIQVMQMSFDKERQQFTNNGMSIISKLEPSLDGIGEAKVIARNMHIIFGLFNPDRYEILSYPASDGYNIGILQNRFRAIKIVKCNDSGDVGARLGILFDGATEEFTELPLPSDKAEMDKVYNYVKSVT